jgi:hypothetical protein
MRGSRRRRRWQDEFEASREVGLRFARGAGFIFSYLS